ncbi:MAG: hypothetical protein AB7K09_19220 [Planctomycetota bacterium]
MHSRFRAIALLVLPLALVLVTTTALAGDNDPPSIPSGGGQYSDPAYGLTMNTPTWPNTTVNSDTTFIRWSGPRANNFSPNVGVSVQNIVITKAGWQKMQRDQLTAFGATIGRELPANVGGMEAVKMEVSLKLTATIETQAIQMAVFYPKHVVVIVCTALKSGYAALGPTFDAVFNSVRGGNDVPVPAAEGCTSYVDKKYQYSLNSPKWPNGAGTVMIFGPVEAEFASNIGIDVATARGTLADYITKNTDTFKKDRNVKLKTAKEIKCGTTDAWYTEVEVKMGNEVMFIAQLHVFANGKQFLITCTTKKQLAGKLARPFKAALESFRLNPPTGGTDGEKKDGDE